MMYWKDKLISLAESGNLEAQAALTKNLHVFSERETDRLKTLYLGRIRRLAAEGDPEAQLAYGEFICDHRSKEAIKWLKMAAQQGLSDAWFNLAKRYGAFQVLDDNGEIRKEPLPKAEELELERRVVKSYLHGAEADNGIMAARCQYMIASYYEDGNAVLPKDLEQAKYWYKKAADHGDESAARSYQSIVEHPEWFRRS